MKKPRLDPLVFENLVQAAMFYYWLDGHDHEEAKDGDTSFRDAIMAARDELNRNGSRLVSQEEFVERLEDMLTRPVTESEPSG